MQWQPIEIVSDEYADDNRHWSAQHCVNYLPVPAERPGTRSRWQLRQAPGLKPLVRIIAEHGTPDVEAGPIRGMREVEGKLFVVAGNTLYQITSGLVAIPYGTIPGVGRVSMAHNQRGLGNELLIANGSAGYVFNTNTLTLQKVTDEAYPGAFVAAYIDSYLAQVEPQGRYWFHSDLADALGYNSLDRYEAEGQPDRIITLHVSHREVLIFGRETIEPYVNDPSGDGTAPFQRASNTVIECGCSARFSAASLDNSVFFLDDKRIVRRLDGYTPVRISTQPIEQALAECTADQIASAFAFVWEDRGHKVYYLTVPGQFTFGYDVLSQRWHRRMTKGMDRWRLSDLVYWNGKWVGGDYQTGRIYELDWRYALDGQDPYGNPLEYVRRSGSGYLSANENRIRVDACALVCRVGGEVTIPVEFPEQPEGPEITGDAPSGAVDEAYSYSYTVTGGTGVKRVTLRSGTLPPGLTLSQAGVLSGTPTAGGSYSFSIRATDENGLFDDLSDSIPVILPMILLGISSAIPLVVRSLGGEDWNSLPIATDGNIKNYAVAAPGRYVSFSIASGTPASYSTNGGASWTNSAGNVVARGRRGIYLQGAVIIPGDSGFAVYRSTDGGANYSEIAGTNLSALAAKVPGGLDGSGMGSTNYYTTDDAGQTWNSVGAHGVNTSTDRGNGADGDGYLLGGGTTGSATTPFLRRWSPSTGFVTITQPLTSGAINSICCGGGRKLVGTAMGQLTVDSGNGFSGVHSFGMPIRQLFYNGHVYIAVCSPEGGGGGKIFTSPDASTSTWTDRPLAGAYELFSVAQEYDGD